MSCICVLFFAGRRETPALGATALPKTLCHLLQDLTQHGTWKSRWAPNITKASPSTRANNTCPLRHPSVNTSCHAVNTDKSSTSSL